MKWTCLLLAFCLYSLGYSQSYRSYNGTGNNLQNVNWGSSFSKLTTLVPVSYFDSIGAPAGQARPNPRVVSNALCSQNVEMPDPRGMSDFTWAFGQLIDHDLTLVTDDHQDTIWISIPACDPAFDPFCTGTQQFPIFRSAPAPGTGTSINNPRGHLNVVTSWIDGSQVYGSDAARANWLRTFSDGKLKTSVGNLLPFNTTTGEYADPIDPLAPVMDRDGGGALKVFVTGDVRANENIVLIAMHTLFVREHNRLCDELQQKHPGWTDEQLYQEARRRVGAIIQSITYNEYLPALGIELDPYTGYNSSTIPAVLNEFSSMAFRLGHTQIGPMLWRLDINGDTIPQGNVQLKDAFFQPLKVKNEGGVDPILRGLSVHVQQKADSKVNPALRNLLFGPPGSGGMDLAAINIARGRERGLPDYNTMRQYYALDMNHKFEDITADEAMQDSIFKMYGSAYDIDPWVGMLLEDNMASTSVSNLCYNILKVQFENVRDGDRFWYEIDPAFSPAEVAEIRATRLKDVVERNSSISGLQENVFFTPGSQTFAANLESNKSLRLYPNPAKETAYIQFSVDKEENVVVVVYSLLGQAVLQVEAAAHPGENKLQIKTANLPAGPYFVRVKFNDGERVAKLMVE